jgi:hypothetical protein
MGRADWVEAAATFPVAFAQVREDAWLDQREVESPGGNIRRRRNTG